MEEFRIIEPQFEELTEKEAREFKILLAKFVKSYGNKSEEISDKEWLKQQFIEELSGLTEEQAEKLADEAVASVKEYNNNLESIHMAAKQGVSKEQWLANNISKAGSSVSVIENGIYLASIDNALSNANAQMRDVITTKASGHTVVSNCMNLDGFIAEQHHVNSFNANAALNNSKYIAKVKVPADGQTYKKNSVDIAIFDSTNPNAIPVHQYQVKYGANATETIKMLRDHGDVTKYSNQQIVVPPEQLEAVQKAFPGKTVVSQIGGTDKVPIKSNELTKEQVKEFQLNAQKDGTVPTTDWNTFKNKELAIQIGKNAVMAGLQAATITTGFTLASKVIQGESVDAEEAVEVALKSGADAGVKVATTGAIKAAAEKGIIKLIPKGTPIDVIANIACVSIENVKILAKIATGELTFSQAMEEMGRTSISMVYSLGWGAAGFAIGATALSWIPIVGPVIGGLVGGIIGSMAGTTYGAAVYNGIKTVGKGIVSTCKSGWNKLKSVGRKIMRKLRS